MDFKFSHSNINVLDLERSVNFYEKALKLKVEKRREAENGSFILVFMGDGSSSHKIELTWLRERNDPYDLGENESHIAFETDNFQAAYALHKEMDCICYENKKMGIYFISDPDGYWLEIIPKKS